jgi:hypothetical protein
MRILYSNAYELDRDPIGLRDVMKRISVTRSYANVKAKIQRPRNRFGPIKCFLSVAAVQYQYNYRETSYQKDEISFLPSGSFVLSSLELIQTL